MRYTARMDPDTVPSPRTPPATKHVPMRRKFPVRLTVFIFSAAYALIAPVCNVETSVVQEILALAAIMIGTDTFRPTGFVAT